MNRHKPRKRASSIDENDFADSAQEAVPLRYLAGERKIALTWISRADTKKRKAHLSRPGKK